MGGAGTDSTVMNEATIAPAPTAAHSMKASGIVSQRRLVFLLLVDITIVSSNNLPPLHAAPRRAERE